MPCCDDDDYYYMRVILFIAKIVHSYSQSVYHPPTYKCKQSTNIYKALPTDTTPCSSHLSCLTQRHYRSCLQANAACNVIFLLFEVNLFPRMHMCRLVFVEEKRINLNSLSEREIYIVVTWRRIWLGVDGNNVGGQTNKG